MTLLTEFVAAFEVWEVARPYIEMMVTEREMRLIVGIKGEAMTVHQVAERFGVPLPQASEFLQQCYSRCIVKKASESEVVMYAPAGHASGGQRTGALG